MILPVTIAPRGGDHRREGQRRRIDAGANELYETLRSEGIDVLLDDRDERPV